MKNEFLTIDDFNVFNKTILLRVDFNSPIDFNGNIIDDSRIRNHLETIRHFEDSKVVILAHQSRPGKKDFTTTENHTSILKNYLNTQSVNYVDDLFGSYARSRITSMKNGDVLVLENVRFYSEESLERSVQEHENTYFVKKVAPLVDLFFNDAFAVSHRSQVSVVGFTKSVPSGAGPIIQNEISNLNNVIYSSQSCVYSLGGSKVGDSIKVAKSVLQKNGSNIILFSGLVGNIALLATGYNIGSVNRDLIFKLGYDCFIPTIKDLIVKYKENIYYPRDVALNNNGQRIEVPIEKLKLYNLQISDIGNETINIYTEKLKKSQISILNGPTGISENANFEIGTQKIIKAATYSNYSVVGGGHISAEVNKLGLSSNFSHVSSGGGACIEYISNTKLPGIEALKYYYELYKKI